MSIPDSELIPDSLGPDASRFTGQRIRVAILTLLFTPANLGGGERLMQDWSAELSHLGHEVTVLTQRINGTPKEEILDGVRVVRVGPSLPYTTSKAPGLLFNLVYSVSAIAKLVSMRRASVDVLHSNTYIPTLVGAAVAKILRRPHITSIYDVYYNALRHFWGSWSSQRGISRLTSLAGLILELVVIRRAPSYVLTINKVSEQDLVKAGVRARIFIVPLSMNIKPYDNVQKSKFIVSQPYVVFVGRLVFYKNLDTVIRGFQEVVHHLPQAKLVVVGDGPVRPTLEELSRELGIESSVVFCGRVDETTKINLIKGSSGMVFPGLIEGFGMSAIEAFACGKPVVASKVPPGDETFRDGIDSFLVRPKDERDWAAKMLVLLADPVIASQMGVAARSRAEREFDTAKVIQTLESVYFSIMGAR